MKSAMALSKSAFPIPRKPPSSGFDEAPCTRAALIKDRAWATLCQIDATPLKIGHRVFWIQADGFTQVCDGFVPLVLLAVSRA